MVDEEDFLAQGEARRALRAEQVAANLERARRATSIQAGIAATTASVWSRGREVRVTVAASGLLHNVEYAEKADGMNAAALANLTLQTIRQALAKAQESIDEIVDEVDPAGPRSLGVGEQIRGEYHRSFADAVAQLDPDGPSHL